MNQKNIQDAWFICFFRYLIFRSKKLICSTNWWAWYSWCPKSWYWKYQNYSDDKRRFFLMRILFVIGLPRTSKKVGVTYRHRDFQTIKPFGPLPDRSITFCGSPGPGSHQWLRICQSGWWGGWGGRVGTNGEGTSLDVRGFHNKLCSFCMESEIIVQATYA